MPRFTFNWLQKTTPSMKFWSKESRAVARFRNLWNRFNQEGQIDKRIEELLDEAEHLLSAIIYDLNKLMLPTQQKQELEKKLLQLFDEHDKDLGKAGQQGERMTRSAAHINLFDKAAQAFADVGINLRKVNRWGNDVVNRLRNNVNALFRIMQKLVEEEGVAKQIAKNIKKEWDGLLKDEKKALGAVQSIWKVDLTMPT